MKNTSLLSGLKSGSLGILYIATFLIIITVTVLFIKMNVEGIRRYDNISESSQHKLELLLQMQKNAAQIQKSTMKHALEYSIKGMKDAAKVIDDYNKVNDSIYKDFEKHLENEQEKTLFNQLTITRKHNKLVRDTLMKIDYENGADLREPIRYQQNVQQYAYENYTKAIERLSDLIVFENKQEQVSINTYIADNKVWIVVCLFVLVVILILLGLLIRKTLLNLKNQNNTLLSNEKEINEHIQFADSIISSAPDGIIGINDKGKIQIFNRQAQRIFGYHYDEIEGLDLNMLIPDNFKQQHSGYVQHYFDTTADKPTHNRVVQLYGKRKNGEVFPVEVSLNYTNTTRGKIAIAGIKDITIQKQTQKKLQQYFDIIDNTKTYVAITDINLSLVYLNKSFRDLLAIKPEDNITHFKISDIGSPFTSKKTGTITNSLLEKGFWTGENEITTKEGKIIPVLQTVFLHKDDSGKPEYRSATLTDISELKQKEKELLRLNKLFDTNSRVTKLLVDIKDKITFYNDICNTIVEIGDLKLAWIGEYNSETNFVEPLAASGEAKTYINSINISVDDNPTGMGPTGTVIKEGVYYICNNYFSDLNTLPWQDTARKYRIYSSAVFPIKLNDVTIGALNVYAGVKDYFGIDEITLLEEIGILISEGLQKLEDEKEKQQLQNKRNQLAELIEHSSALISISNLNSTFEYINDAGKKAFCIAPGEDLSKISTFEVFTPSSLDIIKNIAVPHVQKYGVWKGEVEMQYRNSPVIPVILVTMIHLDENGQPVFRSSTGIDITEQKRLHKETLKLAGIIQKSNALIGMVNADFMVNYMNDAMRIKFGFGLDQDLSSINLAGLFPPETLKIHNEVAFPALVKEGRWSGEVEWMSMDGSKFTVAMISEVHKNEEGNIDFFSINAVDISDLKEKEKDNRLLIDIIENSNSFVGITNTDSTVRYMNQGMRKAFGIGIDVALSSINLSKIITEETIAYIKNTIIPETLNTGLWKGEIKIETKDGKIIPTYAVLVNHLNVNGDVEYISVNAIDISDIKEKEELLKKQATELRALSQRLFKVREEERKDIAKELHDELGQNLTAMKLSVSWIGEHLDDDRVLLTDRFKQFQKITDETVQTSRRLYNSLYPQMLEEIGLNGAIKWHSNTYVIPAKVDFELQTKVDELKLLRYKQLSLVLYRIYQECTTNMLRYAHANLLIVELEEVNEMILMTMTDDGIGFEPDKVDTTVHHGLLGMKERVLAMDGTIQINSEPGRGTTTKINIPFYSIE